MRAIRAIRVREFGGPEKLVAEQIGAPEPGRGQVLVDVSLANVMSVDTVIRSGAAQDMFDVRPPYVPGCGIAGTVCGLGADTDPAWMGQRVVAEVDGGGYAEQAAAEESALIEIPPEVRQDAALAVLSDGPTALLACDAAEFRPGEWALITAASGGAGSLLVQLACAAGARVIGAARGRLKLERVRGLGAEVVVDYGQDGWAERVRRITGGHGASTVIDGTGGALGRAAFAATADGGTIVSYGACDGYCTDITDEEAAARGIRLRRLREACTAPPTEKRDLALRTLDLVRTGELRPLIALTFPLHRAVDAHIVLELRAAAGKVFLIARC